MTNLRDLPTLQKAKKRGKALKPNERELTTAILKALQLKGVWSWRTNAGMAVVGSGVNQRYIKMAPPGTPDILGVLDGGILFGLEVKMPNGKQSPSQLAWQKLAAQHGVRYRVVRSIEAALWAIGDWQKEDLRR